MSAEASITPAQAGTHEIRALRRYVEGQRGPCDMSRFLQVLLDGLEAGQTVELTITGEAVLTGAAAQVRAPQHDDDGWDD